MRLLRLLLALAAAIVAAAPAVTTVPAFADGERAEPAELAGHLVPPAGWEVGLTRADDGGLDVIAEATGPIVWDWRESSWIGVLSSGDGASIIMYVHRFDTPEHARTAWLSVSRLAEEPDLDFAPGVIEQQPDTLSFATVTGDVTSEEALRVHGRDLLLFIRIVDDRPDVLPSATMLEVVAAHAAAWPRDQFDLPAPSTGNGTTAGQLLAFALGLGGLAIVVSVVMLVRKRR